MCGILRLIEAFCLFDVSDVDGDGVHKELDVGKVLVDLVVFVVNEDSRFVKKVVARLSDAGSCAFDVVSSSPAAPTAFL